MCNYNCETFQNSLQQFQLSLCYIVCDKRFVIIISLPESHRGLSSESPVLMKDPVVVRIAEEKKKSPAQVLLKYSMQRDVIVLPKSVNESRIVSNFEVIKFPLYYSTGRKFFCRNLKFAILLMANPLKSSYYYNFRNLSMSMTDYVIEIKKSNQVIFNSVNLTKSSQVRSLNYIPCI